MITSHYPRIAPQAKPIQRLKDKNAFLKMQEKPPGKSTFWLLSGGVLGACLLREGYKIRQKKTFQNYVKTMQPADKFSLGVKALALTSIACFVPSALSKKPPPKSKKTSPLCKTQVE